MDFYLKYTKRIISSVLLAGVVSSSVMGAASGSAANLGGLNGKEGKTGSSSTQQGLDDSANFDSKDLNQNFLSNDKKDASGISAKDNPKAKKAPSGTDARAKKQTTKNLVYTTNGPSTKDGELNGKQIVNKPGYLKSAVDAVKNLNPKVAVPSVLVPTLAGGVGALAKNYLSNKDGNTPPIPDPVDPDQDYNNQISNENDDPNALQNEPGEKKVSKLWWLFILVIPVILGVYKRGKIAKWIDNFAAAMYIKIFGLEEFCQNYDILRYDYNKYKGVFKVILSKNSFEKFRDVYSKAKYMNEHCVDGYLEHYKNDSSAKEGWKRICKFAFGEDLGEEIIFMRNTVTNKGTEERVKAYKEKYGLADNDIRFRRIYRYAFGYKKYIEDFPDDWWILYEQLKWELKFINGISVSERLYILIILFLHKPHKKDINEWAKRYDEYKNNRKYKEWDARNSEFLRKSKSTEKFFLELFKNCAGNLLKLFFDGESCFTVGDFSLIDKKLKFCFCDENYDVRDLIEVLSQYCNIDFENFFKDFDLESFDKKIQFWRIFLEGGKAVLGSALMSADSKIENENLINNKTLKLPDYKDWVCRQIKKVQDFFSKKFKNLEDNDEVDNFIKDKINMLTECINKVRNRLQGAYHLYTKCKLNLLDENDNKKSKNKYDFMCDYILLSDDELMQKYNFLRGEDLKIENNPELMINN